MVHEIRKMLAEDDGPPPSDTVEMDETYYGGRGKGTRRGRSGEDPHKTPVFGMAERQGRVVAKAVPTAKGCDAHAARPQESVAWKRRLHDEYTVYDRLKRDGYRHSRVHHAEEVYVAVNVHTNTIKGFWSLLKRGIGGVYHSVSAKHLQGYLDEYAFRYNHREDERPMLDTMLSRVSG
jgi:transposase